jgi:hypothetical protein
MKKTAFILMAAALAACCTARVQAQAPVYVGVHGGISIPNLHASGGNEVSEGYSSRLGPYFGVTGQYRLSSLFSLQAEANYSAQGGKKDGLQAISARDVNPAADPGTYYYANYSSVARLNYVEVPVLAKFSFRLSDALDLSVDAGPYVGFLVSAKNKTSGKSAIYADKAETQPFPVGEQSFDADTDIKDQLHHTNWGIQGGAELEHTLGRDYLFLHLGGNYGLVNIQKGSAHGKNNTGAATALVGYAVRVR